MNKNAFLSEIKQTLSGIIILIGFVFVLGNQALVFNSVVLGIKLVGGFLIPSLFFQITLCNCLSSLGIFRKLFRKRTEILILGFLGGFSIPSLLAEKSYSEKLISKNDASVLGYSILCGGPALIIGGIGQKMFGSIQIGMILYASSIISQLIVYSLQRKSKPYDIKFQTQINLAEAVVDSVKGSVFAILNLSGFVIFFSGIANIISTLPFFDINILGIELKKIISYFLESTFSIHSIISNRTSYSVYLVSFFITFGGICLQMQVLSNLKAINLNFLKLFFIKFSEGILSVVITFLLIMLFPRTIETMNNPNSFSLAYSNIPASIFLIAFSVYVLFSTSKENIKEKLSTNIK